MKQSNQYFAHNGDVQAITSKLPKGATKIAHTPMAYGEKSGHIHVATGDVEMYECEGTHYLVVGKNGALMQHVHQANFRDELYATQDVISKADHNVTPLTEGTYKIGIHKRYQPFQQVWDKARD